MNLVNLLEESAKKYSWRRCLISAAGTLSYRRLNKEVNRLTFTLRQRLDIKQGDKVAILLNNSPKFIIAFFAILKCGAVAVPLNVFLTFKELQYILQDSGVKLLFSSSDFSGILREINNEREKAQGGLAKLRQIILTDRKTAGFRYWPEELAPAAVKNSIVHINPDDLAVLIYTSGTTGAPKGVMLSHGNLCSNILSCLQALELTPRERFLLVLPMFHSFTLTVCILVPIYAGCKIVVIRSVRPFRKVLRSIVLNRVTIIVGIPQLFDILKNLKVPGFLQFLLRVKICISGAAALSRRTLSAFKENFKQITLLEGYGLTEASPVVSFNPLNGEQKPGSIGIPVPGVEVKIVREDESEAECEEIGELIVKGPNVMRGYFNRRAETARTVRGGWLFTGDMAKIDSDGYIYIVGRKKDMLIVHGMNVYPTEIENVLKGCPKIKEAAVVGKKDRSKGEIPVAFVVLQESCAARAGEITNFCKGKLANYKIPHLIEFRKELPKTPTGKVLKRKLLETLA